MGYEPIFSAGEDVLALVAPSDGGQSLVLEGRLIGDDEGGVLLELLVERSPDDACRVVYVPFGRIETILILEQRSEQEVDSMRFEGHLTRQKVLDEMDRIFFEMAEKKGKFTNEGGAPGARKPESP